MLNIFLVWSRENSYAHRNAVLIRLTLLFFVFPSSFPVSVSSTEHIHTKDTHTECTQCANDSTENCILSEFLELKQRQQELVCNQST